MKKMIAVVAMLACLAGGASAQVVVSKEKCAQTVAKDVASAAIDAARDVGRRLGSVHDAYSYQFVRDSVVFDAWGGCMSGGYRSLTAQGEASFQYMELLPEARRAAVEARSKEFMLEQARFILGLAGWNAELGSKIAALEKEAAAARRAYHALAAREKALRLMIERAGWGSEDADGKLRLSARHGTDFESFTPCGGDYDGPG